MPACPSCTFWLLCQLTGIFGRRLMWWVWCSICGVPNHWSFRLSWEMFSECRLSASALISWETSDVVVCIPCCWREQFLAWQSSAQRSCCMQIYISTIHIYIYIKTLHISCFTDISTPWHNWFWAPWRWCVLGTRIGFRKPKKPPISRKKSCSQ